MLCVKNQNKTHTLSMPKMPPNTHRTTEKHVENTY